MKPASGRIFYFAYGSNMSPRELAAHCPSARSLGLYVLDDHKLAFTRKSVKRNCGVADIVPETGARVFGVLYEMDEGDLPALDRKEYVAQHGYMRYPVEVFRAGGDGSIPATSYAVVEKSGPYIPNRQYMETILEGAMEHGLPEEYITMLRDIETDDGGALHLSD